MAGEWPSKTLREVCKEIYRYPSFYGMKKFNHGIPVIRGEHLLPSGSIATDWSDYWFVSDEYASKFPKTRLALHDVVMSVRGSIGTFARVGPAHIGSQISPNVIRLSPNPECIEPAYFYYGLRGSTAAAFITSTTSASAVPAIRALDIKAAEIPLPPRSAQRAIAHILGTLDDKIELNRRMNETLEAMARALFKSWFVDFDPVRAKAEGRDTGLPKHIADLFPDSFEDSELGGIPRGWVVGRLGDVLDQRVERCTASTETATRPYVPIDCISPGSLFLTESKPGGEAQSSLTKFYRGDLLFGAMRPYFHKVCIAPFDGTTRTTAFVLFPREQAHFAFAALLLHHSDTIDYATRHSTGSTIPYAVWAGSLEDMPILLPPPQVLGTFDRVVRPLLNRIPERYFENNALAALRDTLLPKLISGELRVPDPERFLREVVK